MKQHAEDCQQSADEMAYKYLKESEEVGMLAIIQSHCDFNLFWLTSISPVLIHSESLQFLLRNQVDIKRKFNIQELFDFDTKYRILIRYYDIETLKDYKEALKKYFAENEV